MAESPKLFDLYEYVAVIAPGAIVTLGLVAAFPQLKPWIGEKQSLGEFGVFLIIALVVGHVVQGFGDLWEALIWRLFGRPSDRVRSANQTLLSPDQRRRLEQRLSALESATLKLEEVPVDRWRRIVPNVYTRLASVGAAGRVDSFNRTYGLLRALSVAFLLLCLLLLVAKAEFRLVALSAIFGVVLTYRMLRFSGYYARDLFLGFINLPTTQPARGDEAAEEPAD
jgi:hypothetical protein